jgi:hypothetical protein
LEELVEEMVVVVVEEEEAEEEEGDLRIPMFPCTVGISILVPSIS